MKILTVSAIAIMTAVLAVPAYSQSSYGGLSRPPEPPVDHAKKKAEDKAYNDALSRMPATKEYDPWQGVREKTPAEKPPAPPKKSGR